MKILYNNYVENADTVIDSYTENPNYDFDTAFKDTRLSRMGKTVDADDQWFNFDFTEAKEVDYVVIQSNNISSSATIKVQANATDVWTSPSVDITMTYNAKYLLYYFSTSETYRYWRVTVDDPTNTDTYLTISNIFIGTELLMPGILPNNVFVKRTNSEADKSVSGQLYGQAKLKYKAAKFVFPGIEESERTEIDAFFDVVEIYKPFILIPWEDDLDIEPPVYMSLTKELEWTQITGNGLLWSLTIDVEQAF